MKLKNEAGQTRLEFVVKWGLANTGGMFLAVLFAAITVEMLSLFAVGIAGLILGLLQSVVLREKVNAAYWIVATGIAFLVFGVLGYMIFLTLGDFTLSDAAWVLHVVIYSLLFGLILGLAQWFVLRWDYANADGWIITTLMAFVLLFGSAVAYYYLWQGGYEGAVMWWLTSPVIYGWVTGSALFRVLNQTPENQEKEKHKPKQKPKRDEIN